MRSIISVTSIALALWFFMPSLAYSKTSVWAISKNGNTLYLGGTVHMLTSDDYPLPKGFEAAYQNSQSVVLEADVSAASNTDFQTKSLNVMTFDDHRSLSTVLDRRTYDAFSDVLASRSIPISVFEKFTPAGATLALSAIEMQRMGMVESLGVDNHFLKRAISDHKVAYFLETVDEQLGFIGAMNSLNPNKLVQSSIKELNNFEAQMSLMISAWRAGELGRLEETGITEMQRDFPSMYQVMLVQRNNAWLQRFSAFIETPEVEFILVGALHMAGEHGLIAQLKSSGYAIEQVD